MNKIVDFDGIPHELARLDRAVVECLYDSGTLGRLGKVELIDGLLVTMSPSQTAHAQILGALYAALLPQLKSKFRLGIDLGVFFDASTMRAPDICIYDKSIAGGFIEAKDVTLAIEISDTSLKTDLEEKARAYAANAIPEYWVVDIANRMLHVHRQPATDGYKSIAVLTWSDAVQPQCAHDLTLKLEDAFDGIL